MMDEFTKALLAFVGLGITMGIAGVVFAFGCAVICRWLGWAPVNTTVNIIVRPPE